MRIEPCRCSWHAAVVVQRVLLDVRLSVVARGAGLILPGVRASGIGLRRRRATHGGKATTATSEREELWHVLAQAVT